MAIMYLNSLSILFSCYRYSIIFVIITSHGIIKEHIASSIYLLKININSIVNIHLARNLYCFFDTNILCYGDYS